MQPVNLNISKPSKESSVALPKSKGLFKNRVHLYDYQGDAGKDKYAIAAKILTKNSPSLNFIQKRYFVLIEKKNADGPSTWYKINKSSLKKRLGISSRDLKIHSKDLNKLIQQKLEENIHLDFLKQNIEPILQDNDRLDKIPRATQGKTAHNIYILEEDDLPFVIRAGVSQERFIKAQEAHKFAKDAGLDLITIPKPWILGNFMIESRIPAIKGQIIGSMAFYATHHEEFEPAVKQFVSFLFKAHLEDLTGESTSFLNTLFPNIPRYDNVLVFAEEEGDKMTYKIGLIDTETFDLLDGPPSREHKISALKTAINFFPYNYSAIIEMAEYEGLILEPEELTLLKIDHQNALNCIESLASSRLKYYEQQEITIANPTKILPMTDEIQDTIKNRLTNKLFELHQKGTDIDQYYLAGNKAFNCLGSHPEKVTQFFEDHIIPMYVQFFQESMEKVLSSIEEKPNTDIYELLLDRIEIIEPYEVMRAINAHLKWGGEFSIKDKSEWEQTAFHLCHNSQVRRILMNEVGAELVEAKILNYYGSASSKNTDDRVALFF